MFIYSLVKHFLSTYSVLETVSSFGDTEANETEGRLSKTEMIKYKGVVYFKICIELSEKVT